MIKALRNYYINSEQKFLGEDKRMFGFWDLNFVPISFFFEKNIPFLKEKIYKLSEKWFKDPRSVLRAKIKNGTDKYTYDTRDTTELLDLFIYKLEKFDDDIIVNMAIDSGLAAILVYKKDAWCFCTNHQFLDGVAAFNLMAQIFDGPPKDKIIKIKNFKYIPILSESFILFSIKNYYKKTERVLTYKPSWKKKNSKGLKIITKHNLSFFKNIKKKAENMEGEKINFASVYASKIIKDTFDSIIKTKNVEKLSAGILVAFKSAKRFNNYGLITFEIDKPYLKETLVEYSIRINNILKKKKKMALATYIAGNVYNSERSYGNIDILFSGIPMTKKKKITFNGILLKSTSQFLNYSTVPVYCMYLSCSRYVNSTLSARCPDIDIQKYEKLLKRPI